MPRNPLVLLWLCVLLSLPACAQPARQSSGEHTSQEPNSTAAPALERFQHLTNLGVSAWHKDGRRGQGIKIAILDSGFRDYRQFLGKGLPAKVKTRSFRKDQALEARDSQHGILCAEVVHALAPEAELLLANWEPDSPQSFLDAVRWARHEGAKIVSCSLIMPSWSDGEGGGEVHRGLAPLLLDTLFFASAGNTAERHWCGQFAPDDAGWHHWRPEVSTNTLRPWGNERVAVEFYGPTRSAFELQVIQRGTGALVGRAELHVDATRNCGRAVVRFEPDANATYAVRVRCLDADARKAEAFHVVVLGGALECTTSRGSIPFPGDGERVLAVGAVDGQGERLAYSSCGPNSREPKPDFVAPVPFPSVCRERPFAGTSAAAPQAAGLAALLWSIRPQASSAQITQALRESAVDLGPPGHDCETGYGLIRLPRP